MSKDRLLPVAGLCLSAAALPTLADTPKPLDTVTVTAERTARPLAESAPHVSVLTRTDLDRAAATDLDTLLRYEPGVSVASDPGRRGNASVTIRGIDGNRILMMVDGNRLPDALIGGGVNSAISGRDLVEPDTLRQVDIVKGPHSALYGSDAIGGAVNFSTYSPSDFVDADKPLHLGLKQSHSSVDDGNATTATLAASHGNVAGLLMLTQRRAHEADNQGELDVDGSRRTTPNPQLSKTDNVLAKLAFGGEGPHRVELSAERFDRDRSTDVRTQRGQVSGPGPAYTALDYDTLDSATRKRVAADYRFQGQGVAGISAAGAKVYQQTLREREHEEAPRSAGMLYKNNRFDQDILGAEGQLEWKLGNDGLRHHLIAGLEANRTDTSRLSTTTEANTSQKKSFPDTQSTRAGIFVQDAISWHNGVTLTPALRYDRYWMKPQADDVYTASSGGAVPVSDFKDGAWSPRLGLTLPLAPSLTGFATLTSGFRAPPFDSAFMTLNNPAHRYRFIANPDLKSETSRGVELGIKHLGETTSAQLSAYYNRYKDFIEYITVGRETTPPMTIYQYQNIGRVVIQGVEAKGAWNVTPALRLSAALALARGDDKVNHQPVSSVDPAKMVLGTEYSQDRWGGALMWTLTAKKTRVSDDSQFKTPGYGVVDLTAWWQPAKGVKVRGGVYNLTDQKYWQWADVKGMTDNGSMDFYTQAGRSFTASLELNY